jgi:hypothetical protein
MVLNLQQANLPPPAFPMTPRSISDITDFIVHHSDGPPTQTPQEIDAEHRAEGWAMCGYNFIIAQDGVVWQCRPLDVVPSAAYGRNTQSVDVCLLGDFQPDTAGFTGEVPEVQLNAVKALRAYLQETIPSICRTIGHRDVATLYYPNDTADYATACPGNNAEKLLPQIRAAVNAK